jgi:hypothetical protein
MLLPSQNKPNIYFYDYYSYYLTLVTIFITLISRSRITKIELR